MTAPLTILGTLKARPEPAQPLVDIGLTASLSFDPQITVF